MTDYCRLFGNEELNRFTELKESELSAGDFRFYTAVSAVYSSRIENEDIDLDSYIKHKRFGQTFLPDYTRRIDDLYEAYEFARSTTCDQAGIQSAHAILSRNLSPEHRRGVLRSGNMYVISADGDIDYVGPSPFDLEPELKRFYRDLDVLLGAELSLSEVFYFASTLHLVYVKIHPFEDGNGRISRLIEKWFLAEKLGEQAWLIPSERYYYLHQSAYYSRIKNLGTEYPDLDYSKALPFLSMLADAVKEAAES